MDCDDLNRMRSTTGEHLLVVLYLLQDPEEWAEDGDHGLQLHEQMYWFNLKSDSSDFDGDSITLRIPTSNIMNKRALHHIMDMG